MYTTLLERKLGQKLFCEKWPLASYSYCCMVFFYIPCYTFMSFCITFQENTSTSGSHVRIALWVSGSNRSTGVTHFQPSANLGINCFYQYYDECTYYTNQIWSVNKLPCLIILYVMNIYTSKTRSVS